LESIEELEMKILIVDDSRAMRMIVKRTLRQAGFGDHEVEEAEDGKEALNLLSASSFGLVLTDWNMPNMTGIELAEHLKANGPKVKIGFVTTEGTAEMRARATEAGALFLIAKPFTADDFKAALDPVIK
jgi:two-component system chemotaxis response regulator CheY